MIVRFWRMSNVTEFLEIFIYFVYLKLFSEHGTCTFHALSHSVWQKFFVVVFWHMRRLIRVCEKEACELVSGRGVPASPLFGAGLRGKLLPTSTPSTQCSWRGRTGAIFHSRGAARRPEMPPMPLVPPILNYSAFHLRFLKIRSNKCRFTYPRNGYLTIRHLRNIVLNLSF